MLAEHDPTGPWRKLARGITLAGLQMTWSEDDIERQGLLPDYFHLRAQVSDGPAINPGTVGAHVFEAFAQGPLYDVKRARGGAWIIHAPGEVSVLQDSDEQVTFRAKRVFKGSYSVVLSGLSTGPSSVEVQTPSTGQWEKLSAIHHDPAGFVVLPLQGSTVVRIRR
jgi:hypothetical protein